VSKLIKPEKKQKNDGFVDYLLSDEAKFLVMRGDYSEADIIQAAVHQNVIGSAEAEDWSHIRFHQCWYKASPIGGQDGYSRWNLPRDTPCRGAYFASVLQWD